MTAATVSKTHFADGQPAHYHLHKWDEDFKDYAYRPSHFLLDAERHHAVILLADREPECEELGCVVDVVINLESAINFIQQGDIAVALNPEDQAALDHERALYVDCFGA